MYNGDCTKYKLFSSVLNITFLARVTKKRKKTIKHVTRHHSYVSFTFVTSE